MRRALRDNAFVAEMRPSLDLDDPRPCDEILNRVRRGVEALGERSGAAGISEREILRRCDLERTEHKVVIADLGISRRAFYYHRRRAFRHLAAYVRRSSAFVVSSTFDRIGEFDMHVRRAAALAALGHGLQRRQRRKLKRSQSDRISACGPDSSSPRGTGWGAVLTLADGRPGSAVTYATETLERYGTQHTLASMYELSATLAHDTRYNRHPMELPSAISS